MTSLPLIALLVAGAPAGEQVKTLLETQAQAWSRGDLEAFVAVYAGDAVFLTPTGITRGRAEVLARYRKRYPDRAAMGTLSFEFLDTRVGKELVTVAARWKLTYAGKPPRSGLTLIVLRARGDGWEIVQDASM